MKVGNGGYGAIFGPSASTIAPPAAGWYAGSPPTGEAKPVQDDETRDPLVTWARTTAATLKREKQAITEQMKQGMNLYRGGTPWWKTRPRWKIGTKLNQCFRIPVTWAAILADNKPRVTYSAMRREDQRLADIATAAFLQAYDDGGWQQKIHNCILLSRIQKKAFLRLTFDPTSAGGSGKPILTVVPGDQVYVDRNATTIDDAEVIFYEYQESYSKVIARFPHIADEIARKRSSKRDYGDGENGDVLASAATYAMPTGDTVNTPPYAASPNPPDDAGGTTGITMREFWTRPRWTVAVEQPLFTSAGEPATIPKVVKYDDGTDEPLRRVFTEGGVIYELPESLVPILREVELVGGVRIQDDLDAYELLTHDVDYPLYPQGRLVTIADYDVKADSRMNPLGYMPFCEIEAYPDGIDFWGLSDIDIIADPYEYVVRLVSMVLDAANLTANPVWRLPLASEMSDEDITNAPGAIQREDLMSLRYGKREAGPEMPNYVMNLIRFMLDQINELSGLNEMALGKTPPKGQLSTETVSMQQDAAGVRFRDALHNIERCMVKLGGQFLELMTRYYTDPVLVQIKNSVGVEEAIPLLGSHLTAPLKVEAKPGSMMPNSPTARLNTMMQLMGSGQPLVDLPTIWSLLQEIGAIDSASALQRRIEKERADPKQVWLVPGGAPQQPKTPGSKRARKGKKPGAK